MVEADVPPADELFNRSRLEEFYIGGRGFSAEREGNGRHVAINPYIESANHQQRIDERTRNTITISRGSRWIEIHCGSDEIGLLFRTSAMQTR